MISAEGTTIAVSPRLGASIDCEDPKVVFRAPGIANAHTSSPDRKPVRVYILEYRPEYSGGPYSWVAIDSFDTISAPPYGAPNWGPKFVCEAIGDGSWGQCTFSLFNKDNSACQPSESATQLRWEMGVNKDNKWVTDVAYYSVP